MWARRSPPSPSRSSPPVTPCSRGPCSSAAALVVVPWAVACARLTSDHAARPERDRVLLIADHGDRLQLDDELDDAPERRAHVVGFLPVAAASRHEGEAPVLALADTVRPTVVVLSRAGPGRRVGGRPGRPPPRAGDPGAHAVGVLRGVAGQAPALRARAHLAAVRHPRAAPHAVRPHQAGRRRRGRPGRARGAARRAAGRARRQPLREPRAAALPPGPRRQGRRGASCSRSSGRWFPTGRRTRWTERRRSPDHAVRAVPAPHPPRRAAPGARHPAGRPVGRRPAAGAAGLRRGAHHASCRSTTFATSSGPGSPAGRR